MLNSTDWRAYPIEETLVSPGFSDRVGSLLNNEGRRLWWNTGVGDGKLPELDDAGEDEWEDEDPGDEAEEWSWSFFLGIEIADEAIAEMLPCVPYLK